MRETDFNKVSQRRKKKAKRKSMGDKELASLEMNIYGVPRIVADTPRERFEELQRAGGGRVKYTEPVYHKDGTVTPGMPIPPDD
jgi:hypothetical protein